MPDFGQKGGRRGQSTPFKRGAAPLSQTEAIRSGGRPEAAGALAPPLAGRSNDGDLDAALDDPLGDRVTR
jgi:hypothetical protein